MRGRLRRVCRFLLAGALLLCVGCQRGGQPSAPDTGYSRYSAHFFDTFDTVIQVNGYTETQEEFEEYAEYIHQRFVDLDHLYDRFLEYSGVNNVRTINNNAGVAPVEVEPDLLEMIAFAKEWGERSGGRVNIAMGPPLEIWHQYREKYSGSVLPEYAPDALPTLEALGKANEKTDLSKVIIDRDAGTIYLEEEGMALDVGAVAKGYAAQLVADEVYEKGFHSFIISAGGNVVTKDPPLDGIRAFWGIGIQDPFADITDPDSPSLDVVFVENQSVITSGDYQRFYMVGDQIIHHIIDPETLWPAGRYRALTVVTDDSGLGDFLSTCLYVMDYEEGRAFAEELGVKVLWVFPDGEVRYTDDLLPILRDRGGATAAIQTE